MSKVAEGAAGGGKPKAKKVVGSGVGVCKWPMKWAEYTLIQSFLYLQGLIPIDRTLTMISQTIKSGSYMFSFPSPQCELRIPAT